MNVDSKNVKDVVITHLHYDHVGNFDLFPAATLHLQDLEMNYATGRHMGKPVFNGAYEVEDVVGMVRRVYAGRVRFHDGDAEIAPGVSLHLIGGHTMGLQVVRVATRRGWVVLASDASHFYANMEEVRPFPIVYSVADMVEVRRRVRWTPPHIIPGHDPLVMGVTPLPPARAAHCRGSTRWQRCIGIASPPKGVTCVWGRAWLHKTSGIFVLRKDRNAPPHRSPSPRPSAWVRPRFTVKNLKLQGSWPAARRSGPFQGITGPSALTGGSIKIETMAAGWCRRSKCSTPPTRR